MQCLDDNAASEFVSGTLAVSAVEKVESHLASCRDCRDLVAALAGSDDHDSNAATRKHEKIEDSQVAKRPTLSIGDRVGRYLVLSSLGAGGMGVVFAAYDPQLDRKVALKLLRANLAGPHAKEARTRLKREAQAIAQLSHPNVVAVYDVGTTDDEDVYIAMEFVEGDTLTTWLKKWPRTWREILEVFHQAARGLQAAHSVGLLHRDFKPDNVLVGNEGRVRVTDFGLARSLFLDDSARGAVTALPQRAAGSPLHVDLTATGTVLGTPRYMPPEQLMGPSIDARADQFSYCVALYEALWSVHPISGATSVAMLEEDKRANPPPVGSRVPPSITRAVMRGLEKDRAKRFPTLGALVHELVPPPQRSSMRYVVGLGVFVLAAGGVAAAMMARANPTPVVHNNDDPIVQQLMEEIARKNQQIKNLQEKLAQGVKDKEEIVILKKQLDETQEEMSFLYTQLADRRARPNVKPEPRAIDSNDVTRAVKTVQPSIEFCLLDLDSRATLTEGAPRGHTIDAVVRMSVSTGRAYDVVATGLDYSPSVKLCVEHALGRVEYPKTDGTLDLRIELAWSNGGLNLTGRVMGQHKAEAGGKVDL